LAKDKMNRPIVYLLTSVCTLTPFALTPALGEDWPEWRGRGRRGVWNESGIVDAFPAKGLTVAWRTPIRAGFAGPAVAAGRVFVTDFLAKDGLKGTERALCLDEKSGRILWTREWDADYGGMSYPTGPRATPTVDGDRVYVVGASGKLLSLDARTGEVIWRKDYVAETQALITV
jgi:outer membrane protein assembly factor BamB